MPLKGSKKCPKCGKYSVPPCKCSDITATSDYPFIGNINTNYNIKLDIKSDEYVDYNITSEDGSTYTGGSKVTMKKNGSSLEFELDKDKNIKSVKLIEPVSDARYETPRSASMTTLAKPNWWKRLFKRRKKKNVS